MRELLPIQVTQQEIIIPLTYFPHASELELVIEDDVAVVRAKSFAPRLHKNEQRNEMLKQVAAFEAIEEELRQQYLDQYVAFHEGELVDHDADHTQLVRRINARYPEQIVLIRQVTDKEPAPIRLGSPRLVQTP